MPFDRPTKNELTTAVREFLEKKLLPELSGHIGFNTRIAINVLKILERELESGDAIADETHQRLLALLNADDEQVSNHELNIKLSKEISERNLTYHDQKLIDHLWLTTMDKLSVDNPGYVSYQQELN
jgi:hypothetical protein